MSTPETAMEKARILAGPSGMPADPRDCAQLLAYLRSLGIEPAWAARGEEKIAASVWQRRIAQAKREGGGR